MGAFVRVPIARWQSRNREHWLELYSDGGEGYSYCSNTGDGDLGNISKDAAVAYMSEILGKRWLGTLKMTYYRADPVSEGETIDLRVNAAQEHAAIQARIARARSKAVKTPIDNPEPKG
jgi:hypothetical protein